MTRRDLAIYIAAPLAAIALALVLLIVAAHATEAAPRPGPEPSPLAAPAPTAAPPSSPAPHLVSYGPWRRIWAPWYGPGYYGRRTACGQTLTKTLIGYASRTGKCGELREFRWKGKTIVAPRVDWGPTTPSLEVDLTAGLVLALGRVTPAGKPYTTWIEMRTVTK